jgi:hypothetical protein
MEFAQIVFPSFSDAFKCAGIKMQDFLEVCDSIHSSIAAQ